MDYKIIVSPLAQTEIENAADYYEQYSKNVPVKFINSIQDTYRILRLNPYYRNSYKNFRSVTVKGLPFYYFL